jgi:hypothetical protein
LPAFTLCADVHRTAHIFEKYVQEFNLFGENINTKNKITAAAILKAGK